MLKNIIVDVKDYKIKLKENIYREYLVKKSTQDTLSEDSIMITDDIIKGRYYQQQGYAVILCIHSLDFISGFSYIVEDMENCEQDYLEMVYARTKGIPLQILETERTYVREISIEDLRELYLIYEDEEIKKYLEPLYEYEEEKEFTEKYIQNMYGLYGYGLWVVFDKRTNQLIGRAGISIREVNGESCHELGYLLKREYRRQGYAYEICKGIIQWCKEKTEIKSLIVVTEEKNIASWKLAYKLGFTPENLYANDLITNYIILKNCF